MRVAGVGMGVMEAAKGGTKKRKPCAHTRNTLPSPLPRPSSHLHVLYVHGVLGLVNVKRRCCLADF